MHCYLSAKYTFPSSLKGPALSNTSLAKNHVGFTRVGPNAVNAYISTYSLTIKSLMIFLPVCRVVKGSMYCTIWYSVGLSSLGPYRNSSQ